MKIESTLCAKSYQGFGRFSWANSIGSTGGLIFWSVGRFWLSRVIVAISRPVTTPTLPPHKYPELAISPGFSLSLSLLLLLPLTPSLAPSLSSRSLRFLLLAFPFFLPRLAWTSVIGWGLRSLDRLRTKAEGFDSSSRSVTRGS